MKEIIQLSLAVLKSMGKKKYKPKAKPKGKKK